MAGLTCVPLMRCPGGSAMQDDMASLFAFNRWATERSLDACRRISVEDYVRALPGDVVSLRATVTHLAGHT